MLLYFDSRSFFSAVFNAYIALPVAPPPALSFQPSATEADAG